MVKKKVKKVERNLKKNVKNPWFKKNNGLILNGRIPINWRGWVVLIAFLTLNFYNVFYFHVPYGSLNDHFGFLGVLLLSIFIFLLIAIKKTK